MSAIWKPIEKSPYYDELLKGALPIADVKKPESFDHVGIQGTPWSELKEIAMSPDFATSDRFKSFTKYEKELVERLIKAQHE